jgi:hypothetical protein
VPPPSRRRGDRDFSVPNPRLFFMHFWANDDAGKLAGSLKAALSKVKLAKS